MMRNNDAMVCEMLQSKLKEKDGEIVQLKVGWMKLLVLVTPLVYLRLWFTFAERDREAGKGQRYFDERNAGKSGQNSESSKQRPGTSQSQGKASGKRP